MTFEVKKKKRIPYVQKPRVNASGSLVSIQSLLTNGKNRSHAGWKMSLKPTDNVVYNLFSPDKKGTRAGNVLKNQVSKTEMPRISCKSD